MYSKQVDGQLKSALALLSRKESKVHTKQCRQIWWELRTLFFTAVPCILILSMFYYQLMHNRIALLKLTLKQLQHVSV